MDMFQLVQESPATIPCPPPEEKTVDAPAIQDVLELTEGRALDHMLDMIGTSRIGSDRDDEVREQILRYHWPRGPEQAAAFLVELEKCWRKRNAYPGGRRARSR